MPRIRFRFFLSFMFGACLLGCISAVTLRPVEAQAQAYRSKPLIIIRFNQPVVHYEKALQSAVLRAMQAKPDIRFTLISFAPAYGNTATQAQLAERAATLVNQIAAQIAASGVSSDRIEIVTRGSAAITHSEVHILVQ